MVDRIVGIDYIRGISALMVILYHYTTRYNELYGHLSYDKLYFDWGYMGVGIFLILTAFLTGIKLQNINDPKQFIFKRVIRLYPIYWICMLITWLVTGLFLKDRHCSTFEFIVNLTMLNGFLGIDYVDGAYWTLGVEWIFYIFIFFIIILKKQKNLSIFCLAWEAVNIVFKLYCEIFNVNNVITIFLTKLLCNSYSHMFVIGLMIAQLRTNQNKKNTILSLIIITLSILMTVWINGLEYAAFLLLITLILIVILFTRDVPEYGFLAWLRYISVISYPLYLLHQNIGYVIIKFIENLGITSEWIIITPIIIVICLASTISKLEKKINEKISLKLHNAL